MYCFFFFFFVKLFIFRNRWCCEQWKLQFIVCLLLSHSGHLIIAMMQSAIKLRNLNIKENSREKKTHCSVVKQQQQKELPSCNQIWLSIMLSPPPGSSSKFQRSISPPRSNTAFIRGSAAAEVVENSGVIWLPVCVSVMDSDLSCTFLCYERSSHWAAKGIPASPLPSALIGSCPYNSSADENR